MKVLDRDRHACQNCGGRTRVAVHPLHPPADTPIHLNHQVTLCTTCKPEFTPAHPHAVALAHLINCERTVVNGHPYLMAQVRMITNPLQPPPGTPELHAQLLNQLKNKTRVPMRTIRNAFPNESDKQLHKIIDWLAYHGFAQLSPNNTYLLRLDIYARPPLAQDLTPIVDTPDLATHPIEEGGTTPTNPTIHLLQTLFQQAGTATSKRQIKKLLRPLMPANAPGEAINSFFNLLEVARVIHKTPDGQQWMFTRRLTPYTNPQTYEHLQFFQTHPKLHRRFKPRKLLQYEQRKRYLKPNGKPASKKGRPQATK